MKRHGNLFASVCDFDNLLRAARKAEKGKRFRSSCRSFNLDLEKNLLSLQRELKDKIYRPGCYHHFKIYEPKERVISAAPYRDRVVHHALVNVIEPIFDASMELDSYANRSNKGTHKAVGRFTQFARKRNYVLKMDIVRYFPSLDHEILMAAIARKVKDNDILWLIEVILESGKQPINTECLWYFPGDDLFTPWNRKRGLPIGNLTSQFFANVYLDSFDHHVKENLKCKFYIRYMDDFVIFDNSKILLGEIRQKVIEYLERLRLKVHLNKAQIWPVAKGTDWLGYRVYPTHRLVRRSNVRKFRRRLKDLAEAYAGGKIQLEQVNPMMMSWIGHVQHADSYGLRKKIFGDVSFQRG
jgi:retron-type reverse transcriptase